MYTFITVYILFRIRRFKWKDVEIALVTLNNVTPSQHLNIYDTIEIKGDQLVSSLYMLMEGTQELNT